MTEYLNKQAVLEFIKSRKVKFAGSYKDIEYGAYLELETIETHIESGAFDANGEVQRLRAALHKITQIYDDPNLHDLTACHEMNRVAKEALSTTIEPTNAVEKHS